MRSWHRPDPDVTLGTILVKLGQTLLLGVVGVGFIGFGLHWVSPPPIETLWGAVGALYLLRASE